MFIINIRQEGEKELLHPYWKNNKRQKRGIHKGRERRPATDTRWLCEPCRSEAVRQEEEGGCTQCHKISLLLKKKWNKNSFWIAQPARTNTSQTKLDNKRWAAVVASDWAAGRTIAGQDFLPPGVCLYGTHHIYARACGVGTNTTIAAPFTSGSSFCVS